MNYCTKIRNKRIKIEIGNKRNKKYDALNPIQILEFGQNNKGIRFCGGSVL
jgi:hypothetical protein